MKEKLFSDQQRINKLKVIKCSLIHIQYYMLDKARKHF